MTRFSLLLLFTALCCLPVSAHAGMSDSYLQYIIDIGMVLVMVVLAQVAGCLIMRFCRHRWVMLIKRKVICVNQWVCRTAIGRWMAVWLLSSMVVSPYLLVVIMPFSFYAIIPFSLIWIAYWVIVARGKWRNRWLAGKKALKRMMVAFFWQCVGYVAFILFTIIPGLNHLVYYTDVTDFGDELVEFKNYPDIGGIFEMAEGCVFFAYMFAFPYLFLFASWGIRYVVRKVSVE